VTHDGTIQVDRHSYTVGTAYRGHKVLVVPVKQDLVVVDDNKVVTVLPIKGLLRQPMDLGAYVRHLKEEARRVELHRVSLWARRGEPVT